MEQKALPKIGKGLYDQTNHVLGNLIIPKVKVLVPSTISFSFLFLHNGL